MTGTWNGNLPYVVFAKESPVRLASVLDSFRALGPTVVCVHARVVHDRGSVFCRDCSKINAELVKEHRCDLCDKWIAAGIIRI